MSRRLRFCALAGPAALAAGALLVAACGSSPVAGTRSVSSSPHGTARTGSAVPPVPVASSRSAAPASRVLHGAPVAPDFTNLAFPDAVDGWALGEPAAYAVGAGPAAAEVWHTATSGMTWQEQWHGAGRALSVTASDANHAWALITCPSAKSKPSCGRTLVATSDGGRRWRVVATMGHNVNRVQFVTARFGIATVNKCLAGLPATRCPGQILVSDDGGVTWTKVLADASPVFAAATSSNQLWAAETAPGTGGELSSAITFLTSTDGGHSWKQTGQFVTGGPVTPEIQIQIASGPGGLLWASLFDLGSCAMHGCGTAELLRSESGGRTWGTVNLPSGALGCGWSSITFSAARDGSVMAAAGVNGAACSPPLGVLYQYRPSGWRRLPSWTLTSVGSLTAVSQHVAYAVTTDGVIARTSDGGQHWAQVLPALTPAGQVDAVSAATALADQDANGAFDGGAILRTGNGGRSWQRIADLPGLVTWLDFPSAAGGVAATYQSGRTPDWELWRGRDAGTAWDLVGSLPAGKGANDGIAGPWMSADGHGLLLTLTGTEPWQEAQSGASGPARIWTTKNWGATWRKGGLLPLHGDTLQGPVSFSYMPGSRGLASALTGGEAGWTGWLIVATPSFRTEIVGTRGKALVQMHVPVGNGLQLISSRTGFAWSITYAGPVSSGLVTLYRTTDGGSGWQRAQFRLDLSAGPQGSPVLAFTNATHGWLEAAGTTWHTTDGGRSWTPA